MSACTAFEAASLRDANSRSGRIGLLAIAWRAMNAASRTSDIDPVTSVCVEASPYTDDSAMV